MQNNNYIYEQFVYELSQLLKIEKEKRDANITFLCIGTTKVIGDSVGPSVGSSLKRKLKLMDEICVIGDFEKNINYTNIKDKIETDKALANNKIVVAIDSALSSERNVGKIFVQKCGLRYGESLKKGSNSIGNICIKAVVGKNYNSRIKNFYELNRVSRNRVNCFAELISNGILQVISEKL